MARVPRSQKESTRRLHQKARGLILSDEDLLSPARLAVLDWARGLVASRGQGPTVTEARAEFGWELFTARRNLRWLVEAGLLATVRRGREWHYEPPVEADSDDPAVAGLQLLLTEALNLLARSGAKPEVLADLRERSEPYLCTNPSTTTRPAPATTTSATPPSPIPQGPPEKHSGTPGSVGPV